MSQGPSAGGDATPGPEATGEDAGKPDTPATGEQPSAPGSAEMRNTGPGDTRPGKPTGEPTRYVCDLCGYVMLDLHCKLVCEQCGYKRDCSDP